MEASPVKPREHEHAQTRRQSSRCPPAASSPTHPSESPSVGDGGARLKYESPFDASLAVARKRSQQEKLWEMFATYALQMSSEDPTRMRISNVVKLLQDCGVIDSSHTEEAKMIEKEVAIVCESFLKLHPSDRDVTKRMDFASFLGLLMHFAQMSGDQDPSRAYDSLVRTCLEKQQKPRARIPVAKDMQECKRVLHVFEEPLSKMFAFYAAMTHAKLEKIDPKMAQLSPPHMGYAECLTFARKYGIIAHGVLTTTEFATIYIDSLAKAPAHEYERVLTFAGFCELMVRVSRKSCPGDHLSPDKKLKGLFQLMWLASSSTSPRALKITDVLKSDKVDVAKLFLIHFEKFWKREHYENYVGDRSPPSADDAHVSLSGVLAGGPGGAGLPPAPGAIAQKKMTRRLSLCVQTTPASGDANAPHQMQRRFSMQPPMS